MDIQKTSKTEQPLRKQVRLERSREKTCQKKNLVGRNIYVQEIWVGTMALQKRKKENSWSYQTERRGERRKERGWLRGLDGIQSTLIVIHK